MFISRAQWNAQLRALNLLAQRIDAMADAQTAAISDLNNAISNLADAIAGEITALQNAITAASNTNTQPDDSADIEKAVTNLNNLTAELKNSVTGASGSPATPIVPQSSPGSIATPGTLSVTPPASTQTAPDVPASPVNQAPPPANSPFDTSSVSATPAGNPATTTPGPSPATPLTGSVTLGSTGL